MGLQDDKEEFNRLQVRLSHLRSGACMRSHELLTARCQPKGTWTTEAGAYHYSAEPGRCLEVDRSGAYIIVLLFYSLFTLRTST